MLPSSPLRTPLSLHLFKRVHFCYALHTGNFPPSSQDLRSGLQTAGWPGPLFQGLQKDICPFPRKDIL